MNLYIRKIHLLFVKVDLDKDRFVKKLISFTV